MKSCFNLVQSAVIDMGVLLRVLASRKDERRRLAEIVDDHCWEITSDSDACGMKYSSSAETGLNIWRKD